MPKQRKCYACLAPEHDHKHYEDHNFMVVSFTTPSYRRTAVSLAKDSKLWLWQSKSNNLSDDQKTFAKHFDDAEAFRDWLWDTDLQNQINIFLNKIGTHRLKKSHPHLYGLRR